MQTASEFAPCRLASGSGSRRFLLALSLCVLFPAASEAEVVTVKGSDTMVNLNEAWAEAYGKAKPGSEVRVTGGGSGLGIASIFQKETDIAASSRRMKPDEVSGFHEIFGTDPIEVPVALDGLAVYVHDKNPVRDMTMGEVAGIFSGRILNWKEVGGADKKIRLYSRNTLSGTYDFFKQVVLEGGDFSNSATMLPSTEMVKGYVARDRWGIGYGGIGYASGVVPISVAGSDDANPVSPSARNVLNGEYPLSRELYLYVAPTSWNDATKTFIRWVLSPQGQEVVEASFYFPLSAGRVAEIHSELGLAPESPQ